MIPSDDVIRIGKEVGLGVQPDTPDTPEQAEFRAKVQAGVDDMRAKGMMPDLPYEL